MRDEGFEDVGWLESCLVSRIKRFAIKEGCMENGVSGVWSLLFRYVQVLDWR